MPDLRLLSTCRFGPWRRCDCSVGGPIRDYASGVAVECASVGDPMMEGRQTGSASALPAGEGPRRRAPAKVLGTHTSDTHPSDTHTSCCPYPCHAIALFCPCRRFQPAHANLFATTSNTCVRYLPIQCPHSQYQLSAESRSSSTSRHYHHLFDSGFPPASSKAQRKSPQTVQGTRIPVRLGPKALDTSCHSPGDTSTTLHRPLLPSSAIRYSLAVLRCQPCHHHHCRALPARLFTSASQARRWSSSAP